jgi:hypothetical protein
MSFFQIHCKSLSSLTLIISITFGFASQADDAPLSSSPPPPLEEARSTQARRQVASDIVDGEEEKNWEEEEDEVMRTWTLTPQLGISYLNYSESLIRHQQSSIDLKLDFQTNFSSRWSLGLGVETQLIPITKNQNATAWNLSTQASAAYSIDLEESSWEMGIGFGPYYESLFVTQSAFGYSHLLGMSIVPSIILPFEEGSRLIGFMRVTPASVSNQFAIQFNPGVFYEFTRTSDKAFGVGVDYRFLQARLESGPVTSSRFGMSVSYGL